MFLQYCVYVLCWVDKTVNILLRGSLLVLYSSSLYPMVSAATVFGVCL